MSRMRKKKNLASRLERASNHLIHFPEAMKGNWKNLKDPCYEMVFIELGCGKGSFIVLVKGNCNTCVQSH